VHRLLPYLLPPAACVALALALAALTPRPPAAPNGAPGSPVLAPDLIGAADRAKTRPESPGRAVLDWWSAEQEGDARHGYALLSSSVRAQVGFTRYSQGLRRAALGFVGQPYVTKTTTRGDRAIVETTVVAFGASTPGLAYPLSFPLAHEQGRWRLATVAYLDDNVRATLPPPPVARKSP